MQAPFSLYLIEASISVALVVFIASQRVRELDRVVAAFLHQTRFRFLRRPIRRASQISLAVLATFLIADPLAAGVATLEVRLPADSRFEPLHILKARAAPITYMGYETSHDRIVFSQFDAFSRTAIVFLVNHPLDIAVKISIDDESNEARPTQIVHLHWYHKVGLVSKRVSY